MTIRFLTTLLAVGAVWSLSLAQSQPTTGPATKPASRPALSPAEVLKFAPKDTRAIVHIEAQAAADVVDGMLKSPEAENPDNATVIAAISGYKVVLDAVQAADVYMTTPMATATVTEMRPPAQTVAVAFRTGLSVEELMDLVSKQFPPLAEMAAKLKKGEDGRYTMQDGSPVVVIDGRQEKAVGEGTILLVIGDNVEGIISSLGTGPGTDLTALLKTIDTSAPVWAAGVHPTKLEPDVPVSFIANIYTDGSKPSIVAIVMKDAEQAEKVETEFKNESNPLSVLFDVKRTDATVTFTATLDDKSLVRTLEALGRARTLAMRAMSGANLWGIGKGIAMYQTEHQDQNPPNLEVLIKEGTIGALMLVSPVTGRVLKTDEKGIPTEPGDYVYIVLPKGAAPDMVCVYEPPEINKGEGGNVLFADGHVQWMKADELRAAVKKTREALQAEQKGK